MLVLVAALTMTLTWSFKVLASTQTCIIVCVGFPMHEIMHVPSKPVANQVAHLEVNLWRYVMLCINVVPRKRHPLKPPKLILSALLQKPSNLGMSCEGRQQQQVESACYDDMTLLQAGWTVPFTQSSFALALVHIFCWKKHTQKKLKLFWSTSFVDPCRWQVGFFLERVTASKMRCLFLGPDSIIAWLIKGPWAFLLAAHAGHWWVIPFWLMPCTYMAYCQVASLAVKFRPTEVCNISRPTAGNACASHGFQRAAVINADIESVVQLGHKLSGSTLSPFMMQFAAFMTYGYPMKILQHHVCQAWWPKTYRSGLIFDSSLPGYTIDNNAMQKALERFGMSKSSWSKNARSWCIPTWSFLLFIPLLVPTVNSSPISFSWKNAIHQAPTGHVESLGWCWNANRLMEGRVQEPLVAREQHWLVKLA